MMQIIKYPRTHHIEGSRLQPGDEDLDAMPFSAIQGKYVVVEEKLDGANSGISFSDEGDLQLQSRGHYLTGGPREKHFNLFKAWANIHAEAFRRILGSRFIAFGEWVYAKHTIFYDRLPHYWMEFDVYDKQDDIFLSTRRRAELFASAPTCAVPVVFSGELDNAKQLRSLIKHSNYISDNHLANLRQVCEQSRLSVEQSLRETDPSTDMEGLYIKVEGKEDVQARYKFIRSSFLTNVLQSGSHWLNRPIIPNQLIEGIELFTQA